ncbi:MAG TPA: hypothetical protein VD927_09975 [Chryseosolibacter sp.]|nr:hypothetical protein [Chryseosolibacter sp.]
MRHLSYILLAFLTGCDGCKLDDPQPAPKTELEKLPAATQEGKNTFGCLINGKAWFTTSSTKAEAVYQLGSLGIGGSIIRPTNQSIGIAIRDGNDPLVEASYSLLYAPPYYATVQVILNDECYYGFHTYLDLYKGTITLTRFDKQNYIVSGLFDFEIVTEGCDTLKITNGRFDIKYIP